MSEPAPKPRIRVAEAVESGVEALLLFLVRYFRTGLSVLGAPRKTARRLLADRHAAKPLYVLPLTYLSIGLFLLSLIGQVAGTSILDWIWFIDDLAGKVTEALSKEVSLVKVAVQALPGVLVVASYAVILRLALRRAPTAKRMVPFVLSYAFGAQAWGLFITGFSFVVLATVAGKWSSPGGAIGSAVLTFLLYAGIFGGLAASFFCPLVFVLAALRWPRMWRSTKARSVAVAVLVGAAMLAGHLLVLGAMILPAYVIAQSARPSSPELNVADVSSSMDAGEIDLALIVLLKNRGTKPEGWESSRLEIALFDGAGKPSEMRCSGDALRFAVRRVVDSAGVPTKYAVVPPGETRWFAVAAHASANAQTQKFFAEPREWDVHVAMLSVDKVSAVACSVQTVAHSAR